MNKSQQTSDRLLILQYRKGEASVLPILVKRYHKTFCERAYWVTKDRETAKDIAQESWISIIDKLPSLRELDSFRSWALRIVYTKAIDAQKQKAKQRSARSEASRLDVTTSDSSTSSQRRLELLAAIHKLPKGKQDIIRLFYAEEYTIKQISTFLDIPVGTVKSRLFKAREKLKSHIKTIES